VRGWRWDSLSLLSLPLALSRPAISALAGKHPLRIFDREAADLIEALEVVGAEGDVDGAEVVGQLIGVLGADDHAGDGGLMQEPGEGDLRHRGVEFLGHRANDIEDVEGAVLVDRREVERHAAAALRA